MIRSLPPCGLMTRNDWRGDERPGLHGGWGWPRLLATAVTLPALFRGASTTGGGRTERFGWPRLLATGVAQRQEVIAGRSRPRAAPPPRLRATAATHPHRNGSRRRPLA